MIRRLCALLFLAALLCGCGKREEVSVGVVNPISVSSLEELTEQTGLPTERFAELQELSVKRYALDPVMFELEFLYGERTCTLRISPGEGRGDISGMYFSWTETLEEDGYRISVDREGHGICLWEGGDATWSLAMKEGADPGIFRELYALLTE